MNNLVIRSIAGIVFSVIVIASAWLGPLALGLLFLLFAAVGLYEFYKIAAARKHAQPRLWSGLAFGIMTYLLLVFYFNDWIEVKLLWTIPLLMAMLCSAELLWLDQNIISDLSSTVMGWIYVVLPFSLISLLANVTGQFSYELPVGFFLILWMNDSGAYLFGRFLGRTKLYEKVSPKKTWEGLIGGIICAFVVGYILSCYFTVVQWHHWIFISLIVAVFANLGDLFESQLKRAANVKDSGNIIPGHGGVLDRFDGLLVSLPVVVAYLQFVL